MIITESKLIEGEEDMDRIITTIPGMENLLRCRDLPGYCRGTESNIEPLKSMVFESRQSLRARALIFNTFEDLDGPVLSQMRLKFPQIFAVGPLHAHLNSRASSNAKTTPSTTSFWEVDRSCLTWLDSQPLKSVVYVSFGSITTLTRERLMEFWHGLVNSKQRFLWVVRPDMVTGEDGDDRIPAELEEGTKERGFIVGWAPQEEVLAHEAIGGFLTHSGWNSTLESLVAGVPMICWPYFADQQINSRFVSEVWKLGLDMKDVCDRQVVEEMVNDLMVHRREEFLRSAQTMAISAHKSVSPGGSSYSSLDDFEVWKLGLDMKDVCDRRVVEEMVNDLMIHRWEEFLKSAQAMAMLAHKSVSPGGSSYSSLDDLSQYIKSISTKRHPFVDEIIETSLPA
ncbi:7-deoxyloganetic acid glucosyltransferase, partial [Mucuna pruriens]